MRPVDAKFPVSQEFGSYATAGVNPNQYGTEVEQLVYEYGNYQPFGHAGQDIACPVGTPVHAIADGTVLWADWGTNLPGDDSWSPSGYFRRWALYKTFPGIVTVIQHDGWISVYAHLSEAPLNPGDRVTEGQQIALSGNTRSPGVSLSAHLHVEALVDMSYSTGNGLIYGRTDPTPYFGPSAAVAAMGSTITPFQEADVPLTDQDLLNIATAVRENFTRNPGWLVFTDDNLRNIQGAVNPPVLKAMHQHAQALFDGIPVNVLNQQFKLADGTVTNLAGILTAINAKPVSGASAGPVSTDAQAVANAVVATLSKQLGK